MKDKNRLQEDSKDDQETFYTILIVFFIIMFLLYLVGLCSGLYELANPELYRDC